MNKENLMSTYYKMCVVIAMGAFLSLFLYLKQFPKGMNGDITKTFFSLKFNVMPNETVEVFNSIIIVFFVIFLINLGVFVFTLVGTKVKGLLAEGAFYNMILSFLLLLSQLAYHLQIPKIVNGEISHSIFHSNFYRLTDVRIIVFNFSYLFITIYMFYNIYIIYKMIPKKSSQKEN